MSLNSFFDSIDTDAQFDVWKKTITQKLVHLKNTIPIENRDELNYVGETLEFINSLNLLSSDFLAHHPNMDNDLKELYQELENIINIEPGRDESRIGHLR